MKRNAFLSFLFFVIFSPLSAELISLKSATGKEAKFHLVSVGVKGVTVQPRSNYQSMVISWDQLDLEWLKTSRPAIWRQKQEVELAVKKAYGPFQFGQTRFEVLKQVEAMKAKGVANSVFGETDRSAQWVCLDPAKLSRFIRFSFCSDNRLSGIEFHMNFEQGPRALESMKAKWKSMVKMVDTLNVDSKMSKRFPRHHLWERTRRSAERGGSNRYVTNKWSDELRDIELCLEVKQFNFGSPSAGSTDEITFFGLTASVSEKSPSANARTDWLVYRSSLK